MALRTLHLCNFQFKTQDIRVVGSETDGGTSLSGISDAIQSDGGGYWQADFSEGTFGGRQDSRRADTLAWRAIGAGLDGGRRAILAFCDRHHQPVYGLSSVPHSDDAPFSDESEYVGSGAAGTVLAVVNGDVGGDGLNATILDIAFTGERPLIGGERFTHVTEEWGPRAYSIWSIEEIDGGLRVSIAPPIRAHIAAGDELDFDNVRCVMRRTSAPSNALAGGLFSSASITLVEDMRPLAA